MEEVARLQTAQFLQSTSAFILALVGIAVGAVTGWLDGELVDRLGVGVDPGAHLDAPSSLSGQPAAANRAPAVASVEPLRERESGGRSSPAVSSTTAGGRQVA